MFKNAALLKQHYAYIAGFTYIGLLIILAIAGIGMSAVGVLWKTEMQRVREAELLHIGTEFREAMISYRNATPGGIKQYPKKLEELLLDQRLPTVKRHLRKLYLDPFTQSADWGVKREQGRIVAIYSISAKKPIKKAGFPSKYEAFSEASTYADWVFSAK